jgi:carbon monoxide dehydrogenase subunit G
MASATGTIRIKRPPADVFAFLADGQNDTQWRPGVLDISHIGGDGLGATYRQGVKGPGGRRIAADYEITDYQPTHRIAFKAIAGPVRPTGEYVLAVTEDGTEVTFSLDAELPILKRLIMGRAVQRSMDAEIAALGRLKQVLEA